MANDLISRPCKALFCIADAHEPDMHHYDVTGSSWHEDTSDYEGNIIAHVYEVRDEGDTR